MKQQSEEEDTMTVDPAQTATLTEPMQVHVTKHYAEHRGDHAADCVQAFTYDPDEKVGDFIYRVMDLPVKKWSRPDPTAFITIRIVTGTEPKEADDGTAPF